MVVNLDVFSFWHYPGRVQIFVITQIHFFITVLLANFLNHFYFYLKFLSIRNFDLNEMELVNNVYLNQQFCFFIDVVTIEKTGEFFRLIYDVKGRFTIHRITAEEAKVFPLDY